MNDHSPPLRPPVEIASRPVEGRVRLAVRWLRFGIWSGKERYWDFVANSARSLANLAFLSGRDLVRRGDARECNLCGWVGRTFYPNTGPGYHESATLCPGCRGIDRHRSLLALLTSSTSFFEPGNRIVEVAPMRGFEAICQGADGIDYTSFDMARHAMEQGDITRMRFESETLDFFVCFHVLEHIPDADAALAEVQRVLKVGATAVLQVPIDWNAATTREYSAPDPRDVGHVRQYGNDFGTVIAAAGFDVTSRSVNSVYSDEVIERFGLSTEPIFLATRN